MNVRLQTIATIDQAIAALDNEAANIHAHTAATGFDTDVSVRANQARDLYIKWSIEAEGRLQSVLHRDEVLSIFSNPRHRDISLMPAGEQLFRSVYAEVGAKQKLLESISTELKETRLRLGRSSGLPAVVDTNFMVHCLRPDQIKWTTLVKDALRLVIPIRVIEELDAMKTDNKVRLRKNSREMLSWLESQFSGKGVGPVKIRTDEETTIEILLSERPRHRPSDADEEVLDVCHDFQRFLGDSLLVTADYGMRLRARAEMLNVLLVPQKYFKKTNDVDPDAEEEAP